MGNLISSLFGPSQEEICEETKNILTDLYEQALSSKDEDELKSLYQEALKYNDCKDDNVNKYKNMIYTVYIELLYENQINSFKSSIDECNDEKCINQWYAIYSTKLNNIPEIKDKYLSSLQQIIVNRKIEIENNAATELINQLDDQAEGISKDIELLETYINNIKNLTNKLVELTEESSKLILEEEIEEYYQKIDKIVYNTINIYTEIKNSYQVKQQKFTFDKKADDEAINNTYDNYCKNVINRVDELNAKIMNLQDISIIFEYLISIDYNHGEYNKNSLAKYSDEINKLTETMNEENKKLFRIKIILSFKKLIVFIFCGYGLSIGNQNTKELTNKDVDVYTSSIKNLINEHLNIDTYKLMLQFSELIPLIYPFDSKYSFNNLDFKGDSHEIDSNNSEKYISYSVHQYISNSDIYKKLSLDSIDETINSIGLISEDNLRCHLFYLGVYFFRYYYANESIRDLLKSYKTNAITYLTNEISLDTLYKETKDLLKKQSMEHWKGLPLMSKKRLNTNSKFDTMPKNTPIYIPDHEKKLATIYILNCIYYKVGDINKGGQYTYKITDSITYDKIFTNDVFFWNNDTKRNATIEEILDYPLNEDKIGGLYVNVDNTIVENVKKLGYYIENGKNLKYNNDLIKLSSDKYGDIKTATNHTIEITDRFFQISGSIQIKELGLDRLGCYALKEDSKYVLNVDIINELLNGFDKNTSLNVMANNANNWMFSSVDYMCCVGNQNNTNVSELVAYIYQEVIRKVVTWRMVIPIQTLCVNITMNDNDYKVLSDIYKNEYDICNEMFDRSTLFMKLDGKDKPISDTFGF